MDEIGVAKGEPVGKQNKRAWIDIVSVSKFATRNTMRIFPGLFTQDCKDRHRIEIGKEIIYAHFGQRTIQATTSNPATLQGGRSSFVLMNETHEWLVANGGHELQLTIENNATKSKDGAARTLAITNAYEPSEDSVAQRMREAWEDERAGQAIDTGVLYDSLEAPADARMSPPVPRGSPLPSDEEVKAYLAAIVTAVRGDSDWLDVDRIVRRILSRDNPVSQSRRFWFNQIVALEDAWVHPAAIDAAEDPIVRAARQYEGDTLRAGWIVQPDEPIVAFFDGSKSDDSTGLVGCRLSDGYTFVIGLWEKPYAERRVNRSENLPFAAWKAPREAVDRRVEEMFARFTVVAFWGDPSHAKDDDDEDAASYWGPHIDAWHREYGDQLKCWSVQSGHSQHSVLWDMTSPERTRIFTEAAETFVEDIEATDDLEQYQPTFRIDGHPKLKEHLRNAHQYPNKYGVSLWKGSRGSSRKIDLAVCAVGARMLRRVVLNRGLEEPDKPGEFWW